MLRMQLFTSMKRLLVLERFERWTVAVYLVCF